MESWSDSHLTFSGRIAAKTSLRWCVFCFSGENETCLLASGRGEDCHERLLPRIFFCFSRKISKVYHSPVFCSVRFHTLTIHWTETIKARRGQFLDNFSFVVVRLVKKYHRKWKFAGFRPKFLSSQYNLSTGLPITGNIVTYARLNKP